VQAAREWDVCGGSRRVEQRGEGERECGGGEYREANGQDRGALGLQCGGGAVDGV
jgi:hypothetical protein